MLGVELIVAISDNCSDSLLSESLRIISGNSDGDADGIHNADCDSFDGRILRITVGVGCTEENMFGASEANEGDVANGISGCWVPEPSIEFDGVVDEMPGVKSGSVNDPPTSCVLGLGEFFLENEIKRCNLFLARFWEVTIWRTMHKLNNRKIKN